MLPNTDTTLSLPSTSVSGLHPGFIDFVTEYGRESWGGFRYWLCWTPYDHLAAELPMIAVSNDLVKWVTPLGLASPITQGLENGKGSTAICNDPEICFDPDANVIHLYHGVYNAGTLLPDRKTGTHWGGGLFCYRIHEDGRIEDRVFDEGAPFTSCRILGLTGGSVTVHRDDKSMWHMWEAAFGYRTSPDGLRWSEPTSCTVGTPDAFHSTKLPSYMKGFRFNHAGGKFNPQNGHMEFAAACTPARRKGGQAENLAMISCDLAEPTAMYVMLDDWLLEHRAPGVDWDGGSLYRAVLMPHASDMNKRRLIYSAFKEPVTDHPSENQISTLVEGDISGHLVATQLPTG